LRFAAGNQRHNQRSVEELTPSGRARRMRGLARVALHRFGLEPARLVLARYAGNALYRVYSDANRQAASVADLFEPGQFLLRIHWQGYREPNAIHLELEWLRALRDRCGLPVPEPVAADNGECLIEVSSPGVPSPRLCSLLRWVKGRRLRKRAMSRHYASQGRLMAELHSFSESWPLPGRARPRVYDWNGLFKEIPALCLPIDDIWSLLPADRTDGFQEVARRVRIVMDELGTGPGVFGLIHADLGVDANLLFWRGEPRAIDFDESGLGYWIYDLAVSLEHCRWERDYDTKRDALLDGYSRVRVLPDVQVQHLDLFMAALDVYLGLWANAVATLRKEREDIRRRFERCAMLVDRYLERGRQGWVEPLGG
jgi:Ser/Thr protein kinase RdoA (MazF antagonist)